ncbi:Ppx/GppA family phosphatase [Levilactobacillus bambusae]|uniref:Exopolyphosphatase n=1 Tax=Levilactobacillus bambusae TaxID=2024736 RepID=A0A2V1MZ17_9LACO|nr:Ppx/GppA family phosphatase [Levilactobacillus bambusae]PWF99339.1 exopolyphosphatase [Levilactobacillus bambusae]
MQYLGIIDIGSNSVRLAIYGLHEDGTYREVKRVKEDSRLSEGMGREKILQPTAIARTIAALRSFQKVYQNYQHITMMGIATAAVRQAKNQAAFLDRVNRAIGITIQVLTGTEEAHFDYLGTVNELKVSDYLLLDTGGASCELVYVSNRNSRAEISVPFGAVSLSERFNLQNRVRAADLFSAQQYVWDQLAAIPWLGKCQTLPLVLLGGANRSLARMNKKHQRNRHIDDIHGYQLTRTDVFKAFEKLLRADLKQRKQISGLEPDRADIMVGGMLPLIQLLDRLGSDQVLFSESGVREGIIFDYIEKHIQQK